MRHEAVTLGDKYDLAKSRILITGTQAVVRMALTQRARDRRMGKRTAGYVSGYRGSPLGGLDQQFERAEAILRPADILFQPAVNEDLAATALWGTQQADARRGLDGVFGRRAARVGRSGDALKHANLRQSTRGARAPMGDDHLQSDHGAPVGIRLVGAMIPICRPPGSGSDRPAVGCPVALRRRLSS
jgi:indolepyruvate ferredoxin oxidoreductase